jgi:hypothetical protein
MPRTWSTPCFRRIAPSPGTAPLRSTPERMRPHVGAGPLLEVDAPSARVVEAPFVSSRNLCVTRHCVMTDRPGLEAVSLRRARSIGARERLITRGGEGGGTPPRQTEPFARDHALTTAGETA